MRPSVLICGVNVTTIPPGARVYISGEYIGDAPLVKIIGSPGLFKVRVEKDEYIPWEEYVNVPLNVIMPLEVTLTPVKPPEMEPLKRMETKEVESKERITDKRDFYD